MHIASNHFLPVCLTSREIVFDRAPETGALEENS